MYPVQAYHCSYCKIFKLRKSAVIAHEKKCYHNPDSMSCATCLFYDRETNYDNHGIGYHIPICHKGVNYFPDIQIKDIFDVTRPKLKTNCPMWVERPEDEEEKVNLLLDHGYVPGGKVNYKIEYTGIHAIDIDIDSLNIPF